MIYHYTKFLYLPSIFRHGLRPSNYLLCPGEKPVLWFSTNAEWERTVFIIDAPTLREAHDGTLTTGGLARIACDEDVAPYRWRALKEIAAIPPVVAKALYDSAISVGARPGEWRGALETVTADRFRMIEVFDGESWVPASRYFVRAA